MFVSCLAHKKNCSFSHRTIALLLFMFLRFGASETNRDNLENVTMWEERERQRVRVSERDK